MLTYEFVVLETLLALPFKRVVLDVINGKFEIVFTFPF